MSHKKKLLVVSDAAVAATGFGRVAEAILDRLYDTGMWEICQLGINFFDEYHAKPYRIFAASALNQMDWLGYSRIKKLYEDFQPDAVWLFQDFWHIAKYLQQSPEMRGVVTYFPVDAPNVKSMWTMGLASAVHVATYTHFAANEVAKSMCYNWRKIKENAALQEKDYLSYITLEDPKTNSGLKVPVHRVRDLRDVSNIEVIPHGVDKDLFFPKDKTKMREEMGLPLDAFIVGNVNRNQQRKRLDLSMKAFAEFAKDKDDVILFFHDPIKVPEGWDLGQLAHERYDLREKVMVSNSRLETHRLNDLYNACDVMINTSGGEGFGLSAAESAQCRIPQIVPNWSATAEIWRDSAILLPHVSIRNEVGGINTEQCVIDTDFLAEQLNKLYEDPDYRESVGDACFETMQDPKYDWDNIAMQFHNLFLDAAEKEHHLFTLEKVLEDMAVAVG